MRRLYLVIVTAEHDQFLEWLEDAPVGYGIRVVKTVKAGAGNCLRVVEEPRLQATEEGPR